jgi:hypothetical protein
MKFRDRLLDLNYFLKYFPPSPDGVIPRELPEDELLEIIDLVKPVEMTMRMLETRYAWYEATLDEYCQYLADLEASELLQRELQKTQNTEAEQAKDGKRKRDEKPRKHDQKRHRPSKPCPHCKKYHPNHDECWELQKNADKRPKHWNSRKKSNKDGGGNDKLSFSRKQMAFVIAQMKEKTVKPKKKRKVSDDDSDSEVSKGQYAHMLKEMSKMEEADNASNSSSDSVNPYPAKAKIEEHNSSPCRTEQAFVFAKQKGVKRQKNSHPTTEVLGEMTDRHGRLRPVRILLDSGTTSTIVLREFIQNDHISSYKHKATLWGTLGGVFQTKRKALFQLKLPEFSGNKTISWTAHVDETTPADKAQYDVIIGSDLLEDLGIDLKYSDQTITWDGTSIPMKERGTLTDSGVTEMLYHTATMAPILKRAEERQSRILDADYSAVDIDKYVAEIAHLSRDQKRNLAKTLHSYPRLFQGGLGTLNIKPVHLELKPGARPYHASYFPIPKVYETTTKKESQRFEEIGVWTRSNESEWAAPSFIQPKKTGDVRVLTDFRELNKWLVRRPYPLPQIQHILQKMERFKYASALDLSMGYYHIPLDAESQLLCTTILPWGKYKYNKLPMGIACAPDIFQEIMNNLLGDLDFVIVYLDDILILSSDDDSDDDHLRKLRLVLERLERVGFAANLRKSFFMQKELEYLGYLLTPTGLKPQPKKVEAIQRILVPKTRRQLRRFLGMVNYYRDMWRRRSHVLAPLSKLASDKSKWKWTAECQEAFEEAKRMVLREAALAYPDFTKPFHIYTDASDYQLGGVIMQGEKPLAFYTRKLNNAQRNYTTGEQELLGIVETLKNFEHILLGQKIIVHTDHLNLLYSKMATQRHIRWRLLLEEFGPQVVHVKGETNVVADALSRLDMEPREYDTIEEAEDVQPQLSYVSKKEIEQEGFPMLPATIAKEQKCDERLQSKMKEEKHAEQYSTDEVEGETLIHFKKKIYLPASLVPRVMEWYHTYLAHPGMTRMEETIKVNFYWPGMGQDIRAYVKSCHQCQMAKKQKKKYGKLPAKEAETTPWKRVNVDLIGPYTVQTRKKEYQLRAMTMIDPVTGWFEVGALKDEPNSYECQKLFDSLWLARYPRPVEVGHDGGNEFKWYFKELCKNMGIKPKKGTAHNPQSNSIIERIHQVLGNALRSFELEERDLDEEDPWEEFLTAAAYAIRCTFHTTLGATPGQLVFGRDMHLPTKFHADWSNIELRKQRSINASNKRENARRLEHQYSEGDLILLEKPGIKRKLAIPRTGPHKVLKVYDNGTVLIAKSASTTETVNIRRIHPYYQ